MGKKSMTMSAWSILVAVLLLLPCSQEYLFGRGVAQPVARTRSRITLLVRSAIIWGDK